MREFVNLHAHCNLGSMLDGLHYVDDLFDKVKEVGQKAIALTDHGALAGHFDAFYAAKRAGVQFIPGCEMYYVPSYDMVEVEGKLKKPKRRHIVLLAQNEQGYKNLLKINFIGFQNQHQAMGKVYSVIDWDNLAAHAEGIAVTSACGSGPISKLIMAEDYDEAKRTALQFAETFKDRFFLEIHPHHLKAKGADQHAINTNLIQISKETGIPLVVAVDSHYLTKDMEKYHDMLIAINSKSKVNDPDRFRYGVDDFYVKTADEVYDFISTHYGEEIATQSMANTVRVAEMCEEPNYLQVEGNHLPKFPVKDEPDYEEFLKWREEKKLINLEEDTAYMRFKCLEGFKKKFSHLPLEDRKLRWDRVKEELKVLEGNNFSSYMLVVADFIKWAKDNGILVGPGRGCLAGDALVLTSRGYKQLKDIKIGDFVFTHTGELKEVVNTLDYPVDELVLKIKTDYSCGEIVLTNDHKLWAVKAEKTARYDMFIRNNWKDPFKGEKYALRNNPTWIEAKDLSKDDFIFMPFPKNRRTVDVHRLNLAPFIGPHDKVNGDKIETSLPLVNDLAIRAISKKTNLDRGTIKRAKTNKKILSSTKSIISEYLDIFGLSFSEWQSQENVEKRIIDSTIKVDEEFCYILGRWIGDGWIIDKNQSYCIGIAFNRNDITGKNRVLSYFNNLGFYCSVQAHASKDLDQIMIYSYSLTKLFRNLFPDYKDKSHTKYISDSWKYLPYNKLKSLIDGIIDSDGSRSESNRDSIDTTSMRLMKDIREVLLYLGVVSSVSIRDEHKRGEYLCRKSYKIRLYMDKSTSFSRKRMFDNGYYTQIKDVCETNIDRVYDIEVRDNHSYLTQNYAVHNSAGGCMIAHLLGIHTVDPIEYGLLFERFQNAQKKDLPDIDIDFTSAGRDMVQEYVRRKYGRDHCAQVSNINTYTPKNAIPDLVKSMREVLPRTLMPTPNDYFKVSNKIKDAIDKDAKTIEKALNDSKDFRKIAEQAPELIDYARVIVGMPKEYSTHAAAMVISDIPIVEFAPLRIDKNGVVAVQYEKNRCESVGLIKMDFLAISTLDIIDETFKNIRRLGIENAPQSMDDIPLGDGETYAMIQKGQTRCVFQLGKSGTMAGLCKQVKPQNILDIAAVNALGRPSCGPIKLPDGTEYSERHDYIMRRNGRKKVTYLHPSLEIPLKETFGMCIMEEQLMGVAREVAGWDLNKADGLRKLTKLKGKNPQLAMQLESDFIQDAMKKHNMEYELAEDIWKKVIEKFSGYGFNKSHAVFYSLIGYYTAYLKKHYPAAFLAAYLKVRTERGGVSRDDEIAMAKTECRRLKVKITPPDINNSGTGYDVLDQGTIVMGFAAIKGLGERAVNEIVNKQPYESFMDFVFKTDGRVINKSKMEALAKAGCFDSLGVPRRCIHDEGKSIRDKMNNFLRRKQKDGYSAESAFEEFPGNFVSENDWDKPNQLKYEQEVLGELVSGTIHDLYPGFFRGYGVTPLSRIRRMPARTDVVVEGIIAAFNREFQIKKAGRLQGKMMAKYQLEDVQGTQIELTIWPDLYTEAKKYFQVGSPVRIKCRVSEFEGSKSLMLESIEKCQKNT